jgi:6-phosphogluconolactonase
VREMPAGDTPPSVRIFGTAEEVAAAAAERFAGLAREAVAARGAFSVALAGGNTPRRVYELLAEEELSGRVPWPDVHVFFGDERAVAPDADESNFRMAREALLSRVPVLGEHVHRIEGLGDAAANASRYEDELRGFFGDADWPRFDLVMLGMGDDGHTASLFPETTVLHERAAWAAPVWVEKLRAWRITLTAPAINAARHVLFLVSGAGKAARLREVLRGGRDPQRLPARLIGPADGNLEWFVDRAAAAELDSSGL